MLAASRVLVAVSTQSIAAVQHVADHLTRTSRLCDRLVVKGLVNRADDPANRRELVLTLTPDGIRVVREVMRRRRGATRRLRDAGTRIRHRTDPIHGEQRRHTWLE